MLEVKLADINAAAWRDLRSDPNTAHDLDQTATLNRVWQWDAPAADDSTCS